MEWLPSSAYRWEKWRWTREEGQTHEGNPQPVEEVLYWGEVYLSHKRVFCTPPRQTMDQKQKNRVVSNTILHNSVLYLQVFPKLQAINRQPEAGPVSHAFLIWVVFPVLQPLVRGLLPPLWVSPWPLNLGNTWSVHLPSSLKAATLPGRTWRGSWWWESSWTPPSRPELSLGGRLHPGPACKLRPASLHSRACEGQKEDSLSHRLS